MLFKQIIGQENIKERLRKQAETGIVPHAQLLTGSNGNGTFGLALAYARYLNCSNPTKEDACGHCPSCLKYDELAHPDLHFIFPIVSRKEKKKEVCDDYLSEWRSLLKNNPYFGQDDWLEEIEAGNSQPIIYAKESDEIIRKLSLRIYEARYRILLVWLPEKMHLSCANKLLKVIEEPPANTVLLLVSEEPQTILGTILSRTQRIDVGAIENQSLKQALIEEGLSQEDAQQIAHLSAGNWSKALQSISLNEESGIFLEYFKQMMRCSWQRNVKGMQELGVQLSGLGRERQKSFLNYCQHLIRENFVHRFNTKELNYMNGAEESFAKNFAPYVNEKNVFSLIDALSEAAYHIERNVNGRMVFFDLCLQITVLIRQ